jgi:hypothetical protein
MAFATMNSVRYACTSLAGTNKVGQLKRDENGYYEMIVGALNMFNSAGQYYVYEQAKEIFQASSHLMRRVQRGALRGEYGHPKQQIGQTNQEYANRILAIWEENVCCHHKEIWLDFDNVKDVDGKPVIAIMSKVSPNGPYGHVLEKQLLNKDENVCFSIRSFTEDYRDGRIIKKILRTVVTFDYVNEPGMAVAEKFKSPSLENHLDMSFSRGELDRVLKNMKQPGIGNESGLMSITELYDSLGWNFGMGQKQTDRPSYTSW